MFGGILDSARSLHLLDSGEAVFQSKEADYMISLENISSPHSLSGVTLSIPEGIHVTVCGPSGAGKTTLLRIIAGLEPLTSGRLVLAGKLAAEPSGSLVPAHERGIGMMFQDLGLWPHLSVEENVAIALPRSMPRRERVSQVRETLNACGLDGVLRRPASSLSGGQQSRVALARAIVAKPRILLLDEPFSSLDIMLKETLGAMLGSMLRQAAVTTISVIHDAADAARIEPNRVICLIDGNISENLSIDELQSAKPSTEFLGKWRMFYNLPRPENRGRP